MKKPLPLIFAFVLAASLASCGKPETGTSPPPDASPSPTAEATTAEPSAPPEPEPSPTAEPPSATPAAVVSPAPTVTPTAATEPTATPAAVVSPAPSATPTEATEPPATPTTGAPESLNITILVPGSDDVRLTLENVYDEYTLETASRWSENQRIEIAQYTFFFQVPGALTSSEYVSGTQERSNLDGTPWGANRKDVNSGVRTLFGIPDPPDTTSYLAFYNFDLYSDGMPFDGDSRDGTIVIANISFICRMPDADYGDLRPVAELSV